MTHEANNREFENYPAWMIMLCNAQLLAIYVLGSLLFYHLGIWWLPAYLAYVALMEFRLMRGHCVDCHYYGKWCAFGRGKMSSLLFAPGDPRKFRDRKIEWRDLIPDLLVALLPLIAGAASLIAGFSWYVLALMIGMLLLSSAGNGFIRGAIACRHCKQRAFGCPAEKLFGQTGRSQNGTEKAKGSQ